MKVNKKSKDFTNFDIGATKEAQENAAAFENATTKKYEVLDIPLEDIVFNPQNTRFNDGDTVDKIQELANNLKSHPLLHPIVLIPYNENKYMLISGERRTRAYQMLNRRTIPAMVFPNSDDLENMENLYEANLQSRTLSAKTRFLAVKDLDEEYKKKAKTISTAEMAKKLQQSAASVKRARELLQNAEDGDIELLELGEIGLNEFKQRTMEIVAKKEKSKYQRNIEILGRKTENLSYTNYINSSGTTVYSIVRDENGKYCTSVTDANMFKVPLHFQNQVFDTPEGAQISLDMFAIQNKLTIYTGDLSEFKNNTAPLPLDKSPAIAESTQDNESEEAEKTLFAQEYNEHTEEPDTSAEDSNETSIINDTNNDNEVKDEEEDEDNDNDNDDNTITDEKVTNPDLSADTNSDAQVNKQNAIKNENLITDNSDKEYLNHCAHFSGYGIEDGIFHEGALLLKGLHAYIITNLEVESAVRAGNATQTAKAYFIEVERKSIRLIPEG